MAPMRSLLLFLAAAVSAFAASPVALFNGKDLSGWKLITAKGADIATVCTVKPDGVLAVAGNPVGYLATTGAYANYRLRLEYRWPANAAKESNGGALVHIASGPIDRKTWPLCFQVQTKIGRIGDLLPMAGATCAELVTAPGKTPQVERLKPSSEKPLGEWNVFEIVCRGDTIECSINGVVQNRVTRCEPRSGQIGFQLETAPYELRRIELAPLE